MSGDRTLLDEAEREARALLAHAPDAPYGHSLLGHIDYERGRMPEAVHHLKRALERAPNDSDTILMLAMTYVGAGQSELALQTARRMMATDPLSPMSWMAAGVPQWFVGRPEQAIAPLQRGLEIDAQNFILHWCIGYSYALLGRLADAARHAEVLNDLGPDVPYTRQLLALIDGLEGRPDAALARIVALDTSPLDAHHLFHLGESFILAGQPSRGLELLERSVDGFYPYVYMAEYCRFLDPVRDTPRFMAVLAAARGRSEALARSEAASVESMRDS